mgnify:CR=1 FL=1
MSAEQSFRIDSFVSIDYGQYHRCKKQGDIPMKNLKLAILVLFLPLLAACNDDETNGDEFAGRWVHERQDEIMQIDRLDDRQFKVEYGSYLLESWKVRTSGATLTDDGTLMIQALGSPATIADGKLIARGQTWVSAPSGWTLRDGRALLKN